MIAAEISDIHYYTVQGLIRVQHLGNKLKVLKSIYTEFR